MLPSQPREPAVRFRTEQPRIVGSIHVRRSSFLILGRLRPFLLPLSQLPVEDFGYIDKVAQRPVMSLNRSSERWGLGEKQTVGGRDDPITT